MLLLNILFINRRLRDVMACFQVIPESDTPSMDIENVDMNYKANVHECSQRVIYNVHNFWFCSVLCARNAGSTSAV